jgi:hypothetical protein
VWPGRPRSSRDQDERGQEEAHPRDGGVGRFLNIIVQATPSGDASGGPVGEAVAWLAFADPKGRRGEEEGCTALPRMGFFIEPPPDTQQRRRRGERGAGVTKGSYLLLNNLPLPLPLPPTHAPRACWIAWGCVIRTCLPPPLHSTYTQAKISDF